MEDLGVSLVDSSFYGAAKRVYGASDPSINQLLVMEGSGWIITSSSFTDNGMLTLTKVSPLPL